MADFFELSHPTGVINVAIKLPASKSISNRLLIINKLSGNKEPIENLSDSTDTQNLLRIIQEDGDIYDVKDAGTSMRFLAAACCAINKTKVIAGTERMCQRPIRELVSALRSIGFSIDYLNKDGFPPIRINHQADLRLKNEVELDASISSQYVSALLMIAPILKEGLTIKMKTAPVSEPYISMTLKLMKRLGVTHSINGNNIHVPHQQYLHIKSSVEADWSAASYWYIIASLSKEANITLTGLTNDSQQGDRQIAKWSESFGVNTEFSEEGAILKRETKNTKRETLHLDFTHTPDLAQSIFVMAAVNNILINITGIQSLRIKETDRIEAMMTELKKLNARLVDNGNGNFSLHPDFKIIDITFETYKDHRMAMAFAPVALMGEIIIRNPDVVSKSYPSFWKDLRKADFLIK